MNRFRSRTEQLPKTPLMKANEELRHVQAHRRFYQLLMVDRELDQQLEAEQNQIWKALERIFHLRLCRSRAPGMIAELNQKEGEILEQISMLQAENLLTAREATRNHAQTEKLSPSTELAVSILVGTGLSREAALKLIHQGAKEHVVQKGTL